MITVAICRFKTTKMEVTIKVEKTVQIKKLRVKAKVRYWEDAEVNGTPDEEGRLIPCRDIDEWYPVIDIDTGIILNWKQGVKAAVHYKVCDQCCWQIEDDNGSVILSENDGYYVPDTLCPKDEGYGDYIIMDINEDGKIDGWNFNINDFISGED